MYLYVEYIQIAGSTYLILCSTGSYFNSRKNNTKTFCMVKPKFLVTNSASSLTFIYIYTRINSQRNTVIKKRGEITVFSSAAGERFGYLELKRKIYLTIIPLLIMALSGGWLLTDNAYEQFAYPPLAILSIFSLFHLIRVFLLANLVSQGIFDLYMLWSPLYFVIVFFILGGKRALTFCLSVHITTLTITAVNALDLHYTAKLSATILQFLCC
jgi:hypothetical protein